MGDVEEKCLPHPFPPLLKALGMVGGAEATSAAREHKQSLLATVRRADAGKSPAGVAAVEVALNDLLDDGPEKAVCFLQSALIFCEEAFKVMKEDPVEDSSLGVTEAIDSSHSRSYLSRNGSSPEGWMFSAGDNAKNPNWPHLVFDIFHALRQISSWRWGAKSKSLLLPYSLHQPRLIFKDIKISKPQAVRISRASMMRTASSTI